MATLATILPDLLARLEENEEGGPLFWSQTYEALPALVDSMFEAALVTGTVQAVSQPVTLAANTTYFSLQNNTGIGVPAGVICALRMRIGSATIRKATLKGLSDMQPGWEAAAAAANPYVWFPLGVSQFGIYPKTTAPVSAVMDFIVSPVTESRPYSTGITVPFEVQFLSAFSEYAAVMMRAKELSAEAEEADTVMTEYMDKMKSLSMWQNRLDSLVLTGTSGGKATVGRREVN